MTWGEIKVGLLLCSPCALFRPPGELSRTLGYPEFDRYRDQLDEAVAFDR